MRTAILLTTLLLAFSACDDDEITRDVCKDLEDRQYDETIERYPWAGEERFYKMDPGLLCEKTHQVYTEIIEGEKIDNAVMVISPHAGWQYAGVVTASALSRIEIPDLVILIGPNHRNNGENFAVWTDLPWAYPFGNVPVDTGVAEMLVNDLDILVDDRAAHLEEHSNEVQVVWLHHLNPNVRIVPIAINGSSDLPGLITLGADIGHALEGLDEPFLIVATTDLTHFKPVTEVESQDQFVIDPMVAMDATGLYNAQVDHSVSMCGREPVTIGIQAALTLGATKAELIQYRTSYDAFHTGEDNAVGYVSIVYSK